MCLARVNQKSCPDVLNLTKGEGGQRCSLVNLLHTRIQIQHNYVAYSSHVVSSVTNLELGRAGVGERGGGE